MRRFWLGFLLCMGSPLLASDASVTVRVHPNPVVVGQTCRVAISVPMAIASPTWVFQGKSYALRALSSGSYMASWSTSGMGAGRHTGDLNFVVDGKQVSVPVEIHMVLPAKTYQGIESASRKVVVDKTANDSLKIEELETEVLRLSLEKEALQYRVDTLATASADRGALERESLLAALAEKDRLLLHKSEDLSRQWEQLIAQKAVMTQTHEALIAKEKEVVARESEVASRDVELNSRAATLQKWSATLQAQASDIAAEKATLKENQIEIQLRQQDLQAQRSALDVQASALQVQSDQLTRQREALAQGQSDWQIQYDAESRQLDERQIAQQTQVSEITTAMAALEAAQAQHAVAQQHLAQQAESTMLQEKILLQRQSEMASQEQRLTTLYQEFQTHQERFFGLADQLQERMLLLEKRQISQSEQSEAMALRLTQLEQINASLMTTTTATESDKKKTK